MKDEMMDRARNLDAILRRIAGNTPHTFDEFKERCPVGSDGWHSYMGDVLAASHNLRVLRMEDRDMLLQELYVVWTGDTSSDVPSE